MNAHLSHNQSHSVLVKLLRGMNYEKQESQTITSLQS